MRGLFRELRRRRVFTTAGLYVVGAWLLLQVADVVFPGWGVPDTGINVLLVAAVFGFPLAMVFGWFFNFTTHGIRRTVPVGPAGAREPRPLTGSDYAILAGLVLASAIIIFYATNRILALPPIVADDIEVRIGPAPADKPANSVAVLPFTNVSSDEENDYFCDGVSEEILNKLAAYADLHVIGRTSSWQFKGSNYGVPRISNLLAVRYLLAGSVRKASNQLRISARLVDETGAQVWSETFDRTLGDVFKVQAEIAEIVATTVVPQIVPGASLVYEPNLDAYQQFLRGRELVHQRDWRGAEELRKAIDLDPGFAEPYAELAIATLFGSPTESQIDQAGEAIDTALTLHPGMPRALAARGLLLQQKVPPDYLASEVILRQAMEQEPNMVDAMNWLSQALRLQGRETEADALMYRAYKLDPLHPSIASNIADSEFQKGNVNAAEEILVRLVEVPDPSRVAFIGLRDFYRHTGQLVKMNKSERRLAILGKHVYWGLALSYAMLAMWDPAQYWLERSIRDFPDHHYILLFPALMPQLQGRYPEALQDFTDSIASSGVNTSELSWYPFFYGWYLAMAGAYQKAVEVLRPEYEGGRVILDDYDIDGRQALAFALIGIGEEDRAQAILQAIEQAAKGPQVGSRDRNPLVYWLARNAALMGDKDLALERLRMAIDTGWRDYYTEGHDPRWLTVEDDPGFQAMMAEVKADLARQRLEVEKLDAEEDLPALVDEARAERAALAH